MSELELFVQKWENNLIAKITQRHILWVSTTPACDNFLSEYKRDNHWISLQFRPNYRRYIHFGRFWPDCNNKKQRRLIIKPGEDTIYFGPWRARKSMRDGSASLSALIRPYSRTRHFKMSIDLFTSRYLLPKRRAYYRNAHTKKRNYTVCIARKENGMWKSFCACVYETGEIEPESTREKLVHRTRLRGHRTRLCGHRKFVW